MMLKWPIWIALIALVPLQTVASEPPKAEISNGQIQAVVYLPDPQSGFYRSTRFDWSGIVGSLKYGGHEYYGPWFHGVDPSVRDYKYDQTGVIASSVSAAVGPAEEYQTDGKGLGYEEAKGGGTFIKIGVGVLRKPADEANYDHYRQYEIVDSGKWSVNRSPGALEFTQQLSDPASHYAYRYTKVLRLEAGKPRLVIEHVLKNTGSREIRSTMYNHNFLPFENHAPGPDLVTKTAYEIKSKQPPAKDLGAIQGNQLLYLKTLEGKEQMAASLTGFGASPSDFDFRVEQRKTGAALRMVGDRPLSNASVWSIRTVYALEPFVALEIPPGSETKWTFTYDFYLVPTTGAGARGAQQ
jgi:hypothetical protein